MNIQFQAPKSHLSSVGPNASADTHCHSIVKKLRAMEIAQAVSNSQTLERQHKDVLALRRFSWEVEQ